MEYFILTYRVTVDGVEKFHGDAGLTGSRSGCTQKLGHIVSKAYRKLYPEASTITIKILNKRQTTSAGFDRFWRSARKIRKTGH